MTATATTAVRQGRVTSGCYTLRPTDATRSTRLGANGDREHMSRTIDARRRPGREDRRSGCNCVRSASVKSEQPQCHLLLLGFLQPHVEGSHRRPARRLTRGGSHARAAPCVRVKVRATVVDDGRKRQHLGTSRDLHPTPTLYESSSIAFFIYPLEWFVGVFVASADPFRLYP